MSPAKFIVAIPARMASTRLPGKPLAPIAGEPMIVHVARRALAAGASGVVVATDDARIASALEGSGVHVAMTRADHASGSDRLAECAAACCWSDDTIVVNLQGDEPLAPAAGIRAVAELLARSDAPAHEYLSDRLLRDEPVEAAQAPAAAAAPDIDDDKAEAG